MGFSIKITPTNWFDKEAIYSLQLLNSFVQNTEDQIKLSWTNYENNHEVVQTDEDSEFPSFIILHQGLDSGTFDLEGIFRDHFPNVQRKAALITLCSYLENELDKLCILFQKTYKYSINLKDLNGNGIERSSLYLDKVCGLNNCRKLQDWSSLKNIQKIRNLVVHNSGKLYDINGNAREKEIKIVKDNKYLSGEDEIVLLDSYLFFVLHSFTRFFTDLNQQINNKKS